MSKKLMHEYIFGLLDFADELEALLHTEQFDRNSYLMTLIYIEDILDKYGRGMAQHSGNEVGLDGKALLSEATKRMDRLRAKIRAAVQTYDFDQELLQRTEEMQRNWRKQ